MLKLLTLIMCLKQLDKVIVPADKAIAAFGDKPNQNPYIMKIQSYYERKMYKESIKVLETVIQLFPDNKAMVDTTTNVLSVSRRL